MTITVQSPTLTLLTPKELADMLSMPQRTLDDWRHRGVGPKWLRMGKHVRYRASAVDGWLQSLEEDAA